MTSAPEQGPQSPLTHDQLIRDCQLPRLEARALLECASGRRREWLIAHGDEPAPAPVVAAFAALAQRRRDGEPLAYLVGGCEFRGHHFAVDPAVLIPRTDTETIVDWALELAPPSARVIDLGTGSGAIAITLALARPDLEIWATDISTEALTLAASNAARLLSAPAKGADSIVWRHGPWWAAVEPDTRFDLVVSNPPYIRAADHHLALGDLRFEPQAALTPGPEGTEAIDILIGDAPAHLAGGAWLIVEHGFDQAEAVRARLLACGFEAVQSRRDTAGHERVSGGRWPCV